MYASGYPVSGYPSRMTQQPNVASTVTSGAMISGTIVSGDHAGGAWCNLGIAGSVLLVVWGIGREAAIGFESWQPDLPDTMTIARPYSIPAPALSGAATVSSRVYASG